jgi:hypothetical protein
MSARRKDENNNDMMTEKEESLCRAMLVSKDHQKRLGDRCMRQTT